MMKKILIALAGILAANANAFVLVGPRHANENTLTFNDTGGTLQSNPVASANLQDDLGGPKRIDEFYRWNCPSLTYGFDATFVQFFGESGIAAVNDAMNVLNDFFIPRDGSYMGMSELNLARHGFGGNFNTTWLNLTAQNENLMDIKSLALGMMVNYLGLGNPYRYAFTATNCVVEAAGGSATLSVALKNYDPVTYAASDKINDVQYSYRLVHDQIPGFSITNGVTAGGARNVAALDTVTIDMEEFTSDTSGNAYSAVAAIVDAFYGNTDLVWTDVPSAYGFGVFYDGMNAMGGMYQPRHALTYDDAGGLKYMYETNTVVMEFNPYTLTIPADYTYWLQGHPQLGQFSGSMLPSGSELYNRSVGIFPARNAAGLPAQFSSTHPLGQFGGPAAATMTPFMTGAAPTFTGANVGKMAWAYRGGIDTIQFYQISFDSLMNMNHIATNYVWIDTFMTNVQANLPNPATLTDTTPGASVSFTGATSQYFQQEVGRTVAAPDFLFTAGAIVPTAAGMPVAFNRTVPSVDTPTTTATPATTAGPVARIWAGEAITATGTTYYNRSFKRKVGLNGPGIWSLAPAPNTPGMTITFNDTIGYGGFEVVWSGEISVVGNQSLPVSQQQWAYINGPGPLDIVKFPNETSFKNLFENTIYPVTSVPMITLVSDDGGQTAIDPNSLTRTTETLTIMGQHMRNATAIEIVDANGAVVQLLYEGADFDVVSDRQINVLDGKISYEAEGAERRVHVWNTVGRSAVSEDKFNINTGRVVLTGTSHDGIFYNRDEPLILYGHGFKSKQIGTLDDNRTLSNIRLDLSNGDAFFPTGSSSGAGQELSSSITIMSDGQAMVNASVFNGVQDATGVVVRAGRGTANTLSIPNGKTMEFVSGLPTITQFRYIDTDNSNVEVDINSTSPLRRDRPIVIRGTALSTVTNIELVQDNGASFIPPLEGSFTGAFVNPNGTMIQLSKAPTTTAQPIGGFNDARADGFGTYLAKLKLYNGFGAVTYSESFNVNIQPEDGGGVQQVNIAGPVDGSTLSALTPALPDINGDIWDRSTASGQDITLTGVGLKAVSAIYIERHDNTTLSPEPVLNINAPPAVTPGVTVTDTSIIIDTQVAQFTDANYSDASNSTDFMVFRLDSNRTSVRSINNTTSRFLVGVPPVITSVSPSGATDWRRDEGNMTITGTGFRLIGRVDIVDNTALDVDATVAITGGGGYIDSGTSVSWNSGYTNLDVNASGFGANVPLLDSVGDDTRRIRIFNPWSTGGLASPATATGAFTLSATPTFLPAPPATATAVGTFSGTGDNTIGNTYVTGTGYDRNTTAGVTQTLVISGNNFLGVNRIQFEDDSNNSFGNLNITGMQPAAPWPYTFAVGAGQIIFAQNAQSITITGGVFDLNATWADSNSSLRRQIRLFTVGGRNAVTPAFDTNSSID